MGGTWLTRLHQDGDVIQLGVDYQGGTEEMYRCIKIKVEIGRERRREQSNYKCAYPCFAENLASSDALCTLSAKKR